MKKPLSGGLAASVFLALLSLASIAHGYRNALASSKDFQWSPARLFWKGINPYEYFLRPEHPEIILAQSPNYSHLTYYLLAPYAGMPWETAKGAWAFTNVLLMATIVFLMARRIQPGAWRNWMLLGAALACIGYPVRNVIGNGQQTLLCLLALVGMWQWRLRPLACGLCLALLLTKYSFGLQIGLLMLLLGHWRGVAVAGGISLLAALGLSLQTDTAFQVALFQPLSVARFGTAIGFADLMSLGRLVSGGDPFASRPLLAASFVANLLFFGWVLWQRVHGCGRSDRRDVLLLSAAVYLSLGTVYHLKYDLLFMLFGIYAVATTQALRGRALVLLMGAQFLLFWLIPGFDARMSPNPFQQPVVVAAYAAAVLAMAGWFAWKWAVAAPASASATGSAAMAAAA